MFKEQVLNLTLFNVRYIKFGVGTPYMYVVFKTEHISVCISLFLPDPRIQILKKDSVLFG